MAQKNASKPASAEKNKKPARKAPEKKQQDKKPAAKSFAEKEIKILSPEEDAARAQNKILPYVFGVLALFSAVCYILIDLTKIDQPMGIIGDAFRSLTLGLFGWGAYLIPAVLVYLTFFWKRNVLEAIKTPKSICAFLFLLFASALVEVCFIESGNAAHIFNPIELYMRGVGRIGGGALGGFVGAISYWGFKFVGSILVITVLLVILAFFLVAITPKDLWLYIRYKIKVHQRRKAERAIIGEKVKLNKKELQKEQEAVSAPKKKVEKKPEFEDIDTDDDTYIPPIIDENPTDPDAFDEAAGNVVGTELIKSISTEKEKISQINEDGIDLSKIFVDPPKQTVISEEISTDISESAEADLLIEKKGLFGEPENPPAPIAEAKPQKEPEEPKYVFPPIELLKEDDAQKDSDAINAELRANAERLVEVLASFNVKTKITNVSRGPTITRYELLPEAGTRVRAIANLVDDISLGLAASGVRIEAPIPGKAAVGIEVPNRNVATVYVRTLIENERFQTHQSKLTACLGADVAGTPIFCDVAKMPHMLIAGATGMGKSVCINSIIISLLYKSTPDEVKFILIDPKKVEFNLYNGIPHLLVPVVSDPKKAAGSLAWAVTEMERRFELIESVGVRDIKNYNAVTANDPEKEFLPQIVIIIDELADLMMTAPDEVEDSICRIAQKARAAGMHLIIGTQRPSVDVITGLIKANVPSRIACKVASQTDSRVIFDMAGAEKLIGRGDMLYAPVGAMKPIRVQGAFVSDAEVEAVTDFIRNSAGSAEYRADVIERIEKAAANCGQKKSGASLDEGDGESDPMLRPAIELAIESGKISTSLIQRRLSLGYGRAAKLIDRMQELGFVSAPEGQKPREVLITRQQYMEMVVKDEDAIE